MLAIFSTSALGPARVWRARDEALAPGIRVPLGARRPWTRAAASEPLPRSPRRTTHVGHPRRPVVPRSAPTVWVLCSFPAGDSVELRSLREERRAPRRTRAAPFLHPPRPGERVTTAWILLVWSAANAAECEQPTTAVQTSERTELEGQVKATVLNFGGEIGGSGSHAREWQSQLPSQSAVDNQWYLYYLCREYEARRITRDQYCAVSSGLWERVVGKPVDMGECAVRTTSGGATSTPSTSATAVLPGTSSAAAAPAPAPTGTVRRGRWSALDEKGRAIDVFGPVRLGGEELWYVENDSGCLSVLRHGDTGWVESMIVGACSPWPALDVSATEAELTLRSGDWRLVLDFVDAAPGRVKDGRWVGALGFAETQAAVATPSVEVPEWLRVAAEIAGATQAQAQAPSTFPIKVSVDARGGQIDWELTGCTTQLTAPRTGAGWVQFTERAAQDSGCYDGAKVTVQMISGDAVLVQWTDGRDSAQGVLRPD